MNSKSSSSISTIIEIFGMSFWDFDKSWTMNRLNTQVCLPHSDLANRDVAPNSSRLGEAPQTRDPVCPDVCRSFVHRFCRTMQSKKNANRK